MGSTKLLILLLILKNGLNMILHWSTKFCPRFALFDRKKDLNLKSYCFAKEANFQCIFTMYNLKVGKIFFSKITISDIEKSGNHTLMQNLERCIFLLQNHWEFVMEWDSPSSSCLEKSNKQNCYLMFIPA